MTHSHGDHAGGLTVLLGAYPSTPVVFYELEAPYLVPDGDGQVQQLVAPGSLTARLLHWIGLLAHQPITVSAHSEPAPACLAAMRRPRPGLTSAPNAGHACLAAVGSSLALRPPCPRLPGPWRAASAGAC